jgi:hypothetical protein
VLTGLKLQKHKSSLILLEIVGDNIKIGNTIAEMII